MNYPMLHFAPIIAPQRRRYAMIDHEQATQIQAYLRDQARHGAETATTGSFCLFLRPDLAVEGTRDLAIPDAPSSGTREGELARLRAACMQRNRQPRIAFVEEFAPGLAAVLRRASYVEERREELLVCMSGGYRPVPASDGVQIVEVTAASSLADI